MRRQVAKRPPITFLVESSPRRQSGRGIFLRSYDAILADPDFNLLISIVPNFQHLLYEPAPPGDGPGQERVATLPFDSTDPLVPESEAKQFFDGFKKMFNIKAATDAVSSIGKQDQAHMLKSGLELTSHLVEGIVDVSSHNKKSQALINSYLAFQSQARAWYKDAFDAINSYIQSIMTKGRQIWVDNNGNPSIEPPPTPRLSIDASGGRYTLSTVPLDKETVDKLNNLRVKLVSMSFSLSNYFINNWRKARGHRLALGSYY